MKFLPLLDGVVTAAVVVAVVVVVVVEQLNFQSRSLTLWDLYDEALRTIIGTDYATKIQTSTYLE